MSEQYKKRLFEYAHQILELQEGISIGRTQQIQDKTNMLVGFILALEELEEDSTQ